MATTTEMISRYRERKPKRAISTCGVCQKPGFQYVRNRKNGHQYVFTVHFNEPPIRVVNDIPRYRTCYDKGRIYNLDEVVDAAPKFNPKKGKTLRCVRCGHKGRLGKFEDKKQGGGTRYYLEHELIGGTWGAVKLKKRRRCYIKKGVETESLLKKLGLFYSPSS